MTERTLDEAKSGAAPLLSLPVVVACFGYALLLAVGAKLLRDPDTYWHLVVGQWIVAHGAVPHSDMFSHTFFGQPWIAKEWLSQVLYAGAYAVAGWSGIVVLACAATSAAFALLTQALRERLSGISVLVLVTAAFMLAAPHLVARPHVLALPVMVLWVAGLVRASDRAQAPSLMLLPLMTLWANLHGGFTLGLVLMAPIGFEAVGNTARADRKALGLQWLRFAFLAVISACLTPYGPESMLVTYRILSLGEALSSIGEWQAQDFSRLGAFECTLLLAAAFALYRGLRLPATRIVLLLGLLHLALSHMRNGEILGLLGPIFLAAPLGRQLASQSAPAQIRSSRQRAWVDGAVVAILIAATAIFARAYPFTPSPNISPAVAVQKLKQLDRPVLNDYDLGGYLIFAGVAPFIDGRTELYGEQFYVRYFRAVTLRDVSDFLRLLDDYAIGTTLLTPATPAVQLLDRLPGWERVYTDNTAVLHRRRDAGSMAPELRGSLDLGSAQ